MVHLKDIGVSRERLKDYMLFLWPSLETFKSLLDQRLFAPEDPIPPYVLYVCPMCLEHIIYVQEGFEIASSEFSCDHFPPKNVGGNARALVCKRCNNTAGHDFDFVTKDFMINRALRQRIPGTVIQTKVKVSNVTGRYTSEMFIDENQEIGFSFLPEWNKDAKPLQEWLGREIKENDWKADITIPAADPAKVNKAFLKAAYLACFHHWGYEFIFSDTGKHIRDVLAGKQAYPFRNIPAFIFDQPQHLSVIPKEICFISNPKEWGVFAVNVPLTLADNQYSCLATVLIPGPGRWDDLSKLNDLIDPNVDRQVSFTPFTPSLLRKEYRGYSSESDLMYAR